MGLSDLPYQNKHNDNGCTAIFNNTWGHLSPVKNTTYKGKIRFVYTDHSEYGSQAIILEYEFPNLQGPYLHDKLFEVACDWNNEYKKTNFIQEFKQGIIYEMNVSFRNYKFYYRKPIQILKSITI